MIPLWYQAKIAVLQGWAAKAARNGMHLRSVRLYDEVIAVCDGVRSSWAWKNNDKFIASLFAADSYLIIGDYAKAKARLTIASGLMIADYKQVIIAQQMGHDRRFIRLCESLKIAAESPFIDAIKLTELPRV